MSKSEYLGDKKDTSLDISGKRFEISALQHIKLQYLEGSLMQNGVDTILSSIDELFR